VSDRMKVDQNPFGRRIHLSHSHYIRIALHLKDKNIVFGEEICKEMHVKGRKAIVFFGKLTYTHARCANCGMKKVGSSIIKHGFKTSWLTLNSSSHSPTYLALKKQRFQCKHCDSTLSQKQVKWIVTAISPIW